MTTICAAIDAGYREIVDQRITNTNMNDRLMMRRVIDALSACARFIRVAYLRYAFAARVTRVVIECVR